MVVAVLDPRGYYLPLLSGRRRFFGIGSKKGFAASYEAGWGR